MSISQQPTYDELFQSLAHFVVSLDTDLQIHHVAGDTSLLTSHSEALNKRPLSDLVADHDMSLFQLFAKKIAQKPRIGPVLLNLKSLEGGASLAWEVYCHQQPNNTGMPTYQCAFRLYQGGTKHGYFDGRPDSEVNDPAEQSDFDDIARSLIKAGQDMNTDIGGALNAIMGLNQADLSIANVSKGLLALHLFITESITKKKADKRVEQKRKQNQQDAVTPDKKNPTDKASDPNFLKQSDQLKNPASHRRFTHFSDEYGISEADSIKAAVYSVKKVAQSATLSKMTEGFEGQLEKTKQQIKLFKNIVMHEGFEPHFQPIVSLADTELHHFESLARFKPSHYQGNPYQFMCFAEDLGVIQEFDLAMTLKVITMIKRLKTMGIRLRAAVNISGKSIQSKGFLRHFFRILEDCNELKADLSFELTESSQIDNLLDTNQVLKRIREFGHKVALDDFGAGAAGLQYLKQLDVDCVKIDGIYIRQGLESNNNEKFLRSIADLCRELNIETVGECVETDEQEAFLTSIGITYAQGWLYGKAEPIDEAVQYI